MRLLLLIFIGMASLTCSDPLGPSIGASAGPGSVPGSEIRLASLESGDELVVAFHSKGCYHDFSGQLVFRSGDAGIQVAASARRRWSTLTGRLNPRVLSEGEIRDIEQELAFYRAVHQEGFCTTKTSYEISLARGNEVLAHDVFVDRSCVLWLRFEDDTRPTITLLGLGGLALPDV